MNLLHKVVSVTAAVSALSGSIWAQASADVQIVLADNFPAGYHIQSFTPEPAAVGPTGISNTNPTLHLQAGTRYQITYPNAFAHPFEIAALGATPATDVVLLSQAPIVGTLEADPTVAWVENGPDVFFTLSPSLVQALGSTPGYRCAPHPDVMRGSIHISTAPPPPPTPAADLGIGFNSLTQTCRQTRRGSSCRLSVNVSLANSGDLKALPTDIQIYVSDNNTLETSDTLVRSLRCPAINPGQTKSKRSQFRLAAGSSASGKFVIAVLNATDAVAEHNKANNTAVLGPLP